MIFSTKALLAFSAFAVLANGSFFVHEHDVIQGMDPSCPTVQHYTASYHEDTACDRSRQNLFKDTLDRVGIQARLQATGTNSVPSQHTSFCPQTVTPLTNPEASLGFDTVWLVENTASTPVVVAFMAANPDGTYREVSAFDEKISPPNHDPRAILQPGKWMSLQTFEGHVFHVREINKDGSMGRVLLQHRVGLIPVTNKYGHELDCDPNDPDVEPLVEVAPGVLDRDPNFAREAPRTMRPCNVLDVGFRNTVGCPLNAYYTGMYAMKGAARPRGSLRIGDYSSDEGHTAKSCHEIFKFHLGLKDQTPCFMFDWNSKTKYEGTYVGHNFVFRLAKDERIVVDSIALHPTRVIDCPGLKNQVDVASVADGQAIITPVMHGISDMLHYDANSMLSHMMIKNLMNGTTTAAGAFMMTNATEWVSPSPVVTINGRRARRVRVDAGIAVLTRSV